MGAADMEITLVTENSKVRYVGDGARVEFTYDFNPIDLNYVKVYKNLVEVNSPDITVSPGVVTFEVAPLAGDTIVIMRDMPLTYEKGIVSKGIINSDSLDNLAVELLGQIQQVNEKLSRTPTYPLDTSLTGEEIFSEFNQNVQSVKDAKDIVNGKVEEVNSAVSSGLNEITEATSESQTAITEEKNNAISEIQTATAGLIQRAETAADEAEASRANAEEWAQSVNAENIVHRTGSEDITGLKKFKGSSILHIDRNGTNYTEVMTEDNGTRTGGFRNINDNSNTTYMYVTNEDGTSIKGTIAISYDAETDSVFTNAPTPVAGSNSVTIATTNWVADPTKSTNVVHRTGNETINGVKTFTSNVVSTGGTFGFVAQNNNITAGTTPSTNLYCGYDFRGSTGTRLAYLGVCYFTNGSRQVQFQRLDSNIQALNLQSFPIIYVSTPSTGANSYEAINANWANTKLNAKANLASPAFSGTPTVPTPAVTTNNTQAINTQWFNQKIQVVSALPSSPNANVYYFIPE